MWASLNTFSAASGDFAKVTAIFFPLLPTKPQKAKMTVICGNLWKFLFAHPPRTACGFAKREREFLSIPFARHNTGDFWKCQKWAQKNRKPFFDFLSWCAVLCSGGYSVFSCLQFYKLKFTFLYICYFVELGMNFDGFAMNNKYAPHINLVTASAMQIIETGILWNI